jgi:hypothetical protein
MNGGVSKPQTRRSRVKPSKGYQEALLDTCADVGVGMQSSHTFVRFAGSGMLTYLLQSFRRATEPSPH